jgi:hypothetical protein
MDISESRMRQIIQEELDSLPGYAPTSDEDSSDTPTIPKGEWVLLGPDDPRREEVKQDLYGMVCDTYASVGGHVKVCDAESLERYKYWIVEDLDDDPAIDIGIFGKPDIAGNKLGGVGHDGSRAAKTAYKEKSAELRSGASIGGTQNWWGEVSGGPAAALIKRGAPAVENEEHVNALLDGDDFVFHGAHPHAPEGSIFNSVKGWYTKIFSNGENHTKIILGSPSL